MYKDTLKEVLEEASKKEPKTIDSREVAEMMEIRHDSLIRKIDDINEDFREHKIVVSKYWEESSYQVEGQSRNYRCFLVTKRGCEFLAHKTTGLSGLSMFWSSIEYSITFTTFHIRFQFCRTDTYIIGGK